MVDVAMGSYIGAELFAHSTAHSQFIWPLSWWWVGNIKPPFNMWPSKNLQKDQRGF